MHAEAFAWVSRYRTHEPVAVLDIGGRNVNGSPRALFPKADPYRTLDIAAGDGVDIVADAAAWQPDRTYDVVVCCETFEHTGFWPDICRTAYEALQPGGLFVVTTAAPGRPEHSAVDGGPLRPGEYYGNVDPDELRKVLAELGFVDVVVDVQRSPSDVRAAARRPAGPGWQVVDPEGNVVASGPGLLLHMAGDISGTEQETENADGGDS